MFDWYASNRDLPNPLCKSCNTPLERQVSRFATAFSGDITARYNDKRLEGAHADGHWAWEKNTPDGKPRQRFIKTFQDQREYCKQEGLVNPNELGDGQMSADGRKLETAGMKGQWI